jgi:hydroxymethylbilane synthase
VRLKILSRASDLARLQALLVGRAIESGLPDWTVEYVTRVASGDRDTTTPLAALPTKGAFTADLSELLHSGAADLVVHSWKDLPLDLPGERPASMIAATLERADSRDLLLVRRDVVDAHPATLRILSSSPRREWLLRPTLPALLPWQVDTLEFLPVRGNIATRLTRLLEGRGDALVVAKAAIDRLLSFGAPFENAAGTVREALSAMRWMVLPSREVPGAPAQGALAIEVSTSNRALVDALSSISHRPTWDAVAREREILAAHGGGCHEALGATVLPLPYGIVVSVRANTSHGGREETWRLESALSAAPKADLRAIWPQPAERGHGVRRLLDVPQPDDDRGLWVARADALPPTWRVSRERLVWASGSATWRKLAARGVWVHGSAEGLGDAEGPAIDALAGRPVEWHRLTHDGVDAPNAVATYSVEEPLPGDLAARTHFFWTSGSLFRRAIEQVPPIREGWHASGPGRTAQVVASAIDPSRVSVALDYEAWLHEVTR